MTRDVIKPHRPIPWYCKPHHELTSHELELLTRRALRADAPLAHRVVNRADQAQRSISWLRLVHSQWLLVASRNAATRKSTLSVYSVIALERGMVEALLTTELAGPVLSGEVDVQDNQIVIALQFEVPYVILRLLFLLRLMTLNAASGW